MINDIFDGLGDFINHVEAKREKDGTWTVCCDPENSCCFIYGCTGDTEFEAMEDAYYYISDMKAALRRVS